MVPRRRVPVLLLLLAVCVGLGSCMCPFGHGREGEDGSPLENPHRTPAMPMDEFLSLSAVVYPPRQTERGGGGGVEKGEDDKEVHSDDSKEKDEKEAFEMLQKIIEDVKSSQKSQGVEKLELLKKRYGNTVLYKTGMEVSFLRNASAESFFHKRHLRHLVPTSWNGEPIHSYTVDENVWSGLLTHRFMEGSLKRWSVLDSLRTIRRVVVVWLKRIGCCSETQPCGKPDSVLEVYDEIATNPLRNMLGSLSADMGFLPTKPLKASLLSPGYERWDKLVNEMAHPEFHTNVKKMEVLLAEPCPDDHTTIHETEVAYIRDLREKCAKGERCSKLVFKEECLKDSDLTRAALVLGYMTHRLSHDQAAHDPLMPFEIPAALEIPYKAILSRLKRHPTDTTMLWADPFMHNWSELAAVEPMDKPEDSGGRDIGSLLVSFVQHKGDVTDGTQEHFDMARRCEKWFTIIPRRMDKIAHALPFLTSMVHELIDQGGEEPSIAIIKQVTDILNSITSILNKLTREFGRLGNKNCDALIWWNDIAKWFNKTNPGHAWAPNGLQFMPVALMDRFLGRPMYDSKISQSSESNVDIVQPFHKKFILAIEGREVSLREWTYKTKESNIKKESNIEKEKAKAANDPKTEKSRLADTEADNDAITLMRDAFNGVSNSFRELMRSHARKASGFMLEAALRDGISRGTTGGTNKANEVAAIELDPIQMWSRQNKIMAGLGTCGFDKRLKLAKVGPTMEVIEMLQDAVNERKLTNIASLVKLEIGSKKRGCEPQRKSEFYQICGYRINSLTERIGLDIPFGKRIKQLLLTGSKEKKKEGKQMLENGGQIKIIPPMEAGLQGRCVALLQGENGDSEGLKLIGDGKDLSLTGNYDWILRTRALASTLTSKTTIEFDEFCRLGNLRRLSLQETLAIVVAAYRYTIAAKNTMKLPAFALSSRRLVLYTRDMYGKSKDFQSLVDLLEHKAFKGLELPKDKLVSLIPPIKPRYYSIMSQSYVYPGGPVQPVQPVEDSVSKYNEMSNYNMKLGISATAKSPGLMTSFLGEAERVGREIKQITAFTAEKVKQKRENEKDLNAERDTEIEKLRNAHELQKIYLDEDAFFSKSTFNANTGNLDGIKRITISQGSGSSPITGLLMQLYAAAVDPVDQKYAVMDHEDNGTLSEEDKEKRKKKKEDEKKQACSVLNMVTMYHVDSRPDTLSYESSDIRMWLKCGMNVNLVFSDPAVKMAYPPSKEAIARAKKKKWN